MPPSLALSSRTVDSPGRDPASSKRSGREKHPRELGPAAYAACVAVTLPSLSSQGSKRSVPLMATTSTLMAMCSK